MKNKQTNSEKNRRGIAILAGVIVAVIAQILGLKDTILIVVLWIISTLLGYNLSKLIIRNP